MDGLCAIIAHKLDNTLSSDYYQIGWSLFAIITRLKLHDHIIGHNEHMIDYALVLIEKETHIRIRRDELSEVIEYYNLNSLRNIKHFKGKCINIPKVLATDKTHCDVYKCHLTFYNHRKPYIATLYDQSDGSELVSYINVYIKYIYKYNCMY